MLKKLVKYGNSNALILDKAILELLNIEEGSTIKIKTDGISIIITPHTKNKTEKINETVSHNQALIESSIQESFKKYKNIPKNKLKKLTKELYNLTLKHQNLSMQLLNNPAFLQKVTELSQQIDVRSSEYAEAYKTLRKQYSTEELIKTEQELLTFESRNKLVPMELSEEQQKAMEKDFSTHFKKYNKATKIYGELLNNPEYIHEAQLIAEKYNVNKDSADYQKAINELNDKYSPEIRKSQEGIKAIAAKYSNYSE